MATLQVIERAEIARDIHRFELRAVDGSPLDPFTAGANVSVQAPNGMVRRYSLTNDPAERHRYVIVVKRETAGRGGSLSLIDGVPAGAALKVSRPRNQFPLETAAARFLFIAGGIGITPMMSFMRHLEAIGGAPYDLVYLTRSPAHTAFRDELAGEPFRTRVTLHHDGGDPARALDLGPHLAVPGARHVYCCGPAVLMDAVRRMTGHWPSAQVHFESFSDDVAAPVPSGPA